MADEKETAGSNGNSAPEHEPGQEPEVLPFGVASAVPGAKEDDAEAQLAPAILANFDHTLLDPHGVLGKHNTFPGWNGTPFRGAVPNIKEDDPQAKTPETGYQAHVEILDFSNADHLKRYQGIMQIIANGFGVMGDEDRQYDKDAKTWRILIRWWQVYSYVPKAR